MTDTTRISLSETGLLLVERAREVLAEVQAADLSDAPYSLGRLEATLDGLLHLIEEGRP